MHSGDGKHKQISHYGVNSASNPVKKPFKASNTPDSEAISRSSRSSDDIVKDDAGLGSLLAVWAGYGDRQEGKSRDASLWRRSPWKGQAGAGVSSPGLERDSKLPPMLSLSLHPFFSEKATHNKWNRGRHANTWRMRVLSWGILTAIAGSSVSVIVGQRLLRPQSVAGFPFIPEQYCDHTLH